MAPSLTIIGIAGSLRKGSYNAALLRAARDLAPAGITIVIKNIGDLPLFNQDDEKNPPPSVRELKEAVKAADGLLIATPEYNYSVPGVLKNALDWVSRPYGDNSADDKPVAIMGASVSMTGTARAQYHLRQMFVFLNGHVLNMPEVMVPAASDKFDQDGNLTDEKTRDKVKQMLEAFVPWIKRLRGGK